MERDGMLGFDVTMTRLSEYDVKSDAAEKRQYLNITGDAIDPDTLGVSSSTSRSWQVIGDGSQSFLAVRPHLDLLHRSWGTHSSFDCTVMYVPTGQERDSEKYQLSFYNEVINRTRVHKWNWASASCIERANRTVSDTRLLHRPFCGD
jgi:hypothetical protein